MAQVLTVRHNDKDLQHFLKASPKRAALALRASMTKTGNFYRKKMQGDIENATYKKLHPASKSIHGAGKKPLELFARLVRFRVSRSRKQQKLILKIGFMPTRIRGRAVRIGRQKLTPARVATILERGRRQRLTDKWRRLLAARGYPV